MTDPTPLDPPIDTPEAAARRAALAKQRFWIISLFRLAGALIILFGMAVSLQRFGWVQGDKAKWMGIIVSTVGFVQFIIVPRMLIRAFATPRAPLAAQPTDQQAGQP